MTLLASTRTHAAQFYEGEPFLHRGIVTFFTEPMRSGHHTVMIARRRTFDAVVELLRATSDATLVEGAGRIVLVDVQEAINGFMVGTRVDPVRVEHGFMNLIAQVRCGDEKPMWIYGEMAGVLCEEGNHAAALSLEELWNVHFPEPAFSVMCGYAMESFGRDAKAHALRAICRQHTRVLPAEEFTDAADERATAEPIVYLIDDDMSVRRSLSRLLVLAGHEVRVFATADEFLNDRGRSGAGCLILDVQLVGLSSQELQSRLARDPLALPIIAMSGSHDPQVEIDALRLGAAAFLRKPFGAQTLMNAIARAMGTRRK
jgi:CheY-like chemotaxis protein